MEGNPPAGTAAASQQITPSTPSTITPSITSATASASAATTGPRGNNARPANCKKVLHIVRTSTFSLTTGLIILLMGVVVVISSTQFQSQDIFLLGPFLIAGGAILILRGVINKVSERRLAEELREGGGRGASGAGRRRNNRVNRLESRQEEAQALSVDNIVVPPTYDIAIHSTDEVGDPVGMRLSAVGEHVDSGHRMEIQSLGDEKSGVFAKNGVHHVVGPPVIKVPLNLAPAVTTGGHYSVEVECNTQSSTENNSTSESLTRTTVDPETHTQSVSTLCETSLISETSAAAPAVSTDSDVPHFTVDDSGDDSDARVSNELLADTQSDLQDGRPISDHAPLCVTQTAPAGIFATAAITTSDAPQRTSSVYQGKQTTSDGNFLAKGPAFRRRFSSVVVCDSDSQTTSHKIIGLSRTFTRLDSIVDSEARLIMIDKSTQTDTMEGEPLPVEAPPTYQVATHSEDTL